MLQHEPVVGCEVRLTLHGVDDDAFSLAARWGRELHVAGERGAAHADDACVLYLFYDGLAVEFGTVAQLDEGRASVDALFPFVAFDVHIDSHATCAAGIEGNVHLRYLSAHAAMDGSADEAASFCQQRADLHLVAFLDDGLGRCSDMLEHAEDCLLGQSCLANGAGSRQLVFCGMNPAYLKCLHVLFGF